MIMIEYYSDKVSHYKSHIYCQLAVTYLFLFLTAFGVFSGVGAIFPFIAVMYCYSNMKRYEENLRHAIEYEEERRHHEMLENLERIERLVRLRESTKLKSNVNEKKDHSWGDDNLFKMD